MEVKVTSSKKIIICESVRRVLLANNSKNLSFGANVVPNGAGSG